LVLSAAFVPVFPIGLSAIALVALASMVLWDAARRLHQQIEHTVLQVFEQERPTDDPQLKRSHDALVQLIQEEYPWEVQTQDFLLPYQESAANQSIRALRLRTITGATIVAIYREPEPLINPLPETILMPGDVLLLMGNREQVAAAMRFLQQKTHEPSVNALSPGQAAPKARTVQVSIPANSPWIGKTLAALNLRRITDAQVVGVRKAEHTITNPASGVVLEAGDTLVLFGNADQLKHAIAYLVSGNNG
jgi:K+/H+ antiporter YhaU regulatory subunit KhtT